MSKQSAIVRRASQNYDRFLKWLEQRSDSEYALQELAIQFEQRCFSDLRLLTAPIRRRLLESEFKLEGQWSHTSDDADIDIQGWIFRLKDTGYLGLCENLKKTISIRPDLGKVEYHATLLHEMIHAYEFQLPDPYREWLILYLHDRMEKKLGARRLRRYVDASTHSLVHEAAHGVLFLLKSIDLDLRFGWKLGTVFGYGRTDYFDPPAKEKPDGVASEIASVQQPASRGDPKTVPC